MQEYLEKQSLGRTPDLQEKEPSISSPPIDLIASALADFRGVKHYTEKGLPPADAKALFEKENSEYQFFISARILSLASSTFMRERIKVMMASSTKGITRYMSFSILMQDSGCTASALS